MLAWSMSQYMVGARECAGRETASGGGTRGSTRPKLGAVTRVLAEVFLDPQQLVVLRDAVGSTRRAGLDLARVGADHDVRDRRVLGLAAAMADDRRETVAAGQLDRIERLGQRADLVHL